MSDAHSVTELLHQLEQGESAAAQKIWDRFIHRLIAASRRRLQNLPRRAVDEEDVALAAFNAFFQGVKENRFTRLENREDLWQVLAMLAERKAIAELRWELADKRGGGLNRGESVFEKLIGESSAAIGIGNVKDPDPEVVDGFARETRERLEQLEDKNLQRIVFMKLQGHTNKEISEEVGVALRAVERKLQLIRKKWDFASK